MNPTEKLELRKRRRAEAKRLGEDDPYGIYGESS